MRRTFFSEEAFNLNIISIKWPLETRYSINLSTLFWLNANSANALSFVNWDNVISERTSHVKFTFPVKSPKSFCKENDILFHFSDTRRSIQRYCSINYIFIQQIWLAFSPFFLAFFRTSRYLCCIKTKTLHTLHKPSWTLILMRKFGF